MFNIGALRKLYEGDEILTLDKANKIWNILVLQSWILKNY